MTQTATLDADGATEAPRPDRSRRAKKANRRPVRRLMIVTHRWISLVLGLVLLLISTSGAILLYRPELQHWLNHDAYSPGGGTATVGFAQAFDTVKAAHPGFKPTGVVAESGILKVHNADYQDFWSVDPSTGRILGHIGEAPGWVRFLDNFHECFLSCSDEPGYLKVLEKDVPHTTWLGSDDADITWAGLALGLLAIVLLFLSLSGLWLWFPRPSKWRSSMTVRWKRGRFARDTDLHKVAGMIALPALLIWGITGGGFEMAPFEKAWYAVTPGHQLPEKDDPVSTKSSAPDVTIDQAVAAARQVAPGDEVVSVDLPDSADPTGVYYVWLGAGFDPYGKTAYPGDRGVVVDRHTAEATIVYGAPQESTAQSLWDSWSYPVHSGYIVNGWWRLVWLALGLAPLLLGITGVSTWLVRRKTKKARKESQRSAAAAA